MSFKPRWQRGWREEREPGYDIEKIEVATMKLFGASMTIVLAAGLGLALGFAMRRHGAGNSTFKEKSPQAELLSAGKTSAWLKAQTRSRIDDSPLATKLEHDLSM